MTQPSPPATWPSAGNGLAGLHEHAVADGELVDADQRLGVVGREPRRGGRRSTERALDGGRGPVPGSHLDEASEREEEDEHADRLEIDLAAAEPGGDEAGGEGEPDGERDRDVHADAPPAQRSRQAFTKNGRPAITTTGAATMPLTERKRSR